jgi:hypothetical protein
LSFEVTDINAPGNGPTLTLGRLLKTADDGFNSDSIQRAFGEWNLDIPRIQTNTGSQSNVLGWYVGNYGGTWSTVYNGGDTSEAISGKANGAYGYRVQACNGVGRGGWSGIDTTVNRGDIAT